MQADGAAFSRTQLRSRIVNHNECFTANAFAAAYSFA